MIDRHVECAVGETVYRLTPTLDAMRRINRKQESLVDALRRIRLVDFDAICSIISAGAGLSDKQSEALAQEVLEAGVSNMLAPVSDFLALLMNPMGSEEDEGDPEGNP